MADKVLRWYIDGSISRAKTWLGGSYKLDADYKIIRINMSVRETGAIANPTVIDINDDGVSIFTDQNNRPAMLPYMTDKTWTTVPDTVLREDSIITMDVDSVCEQTPCRDLTVEIELELV
jgi:hypothetical protein